ncbi:MAG TPA: site-2 protease family protein [Syntrophales bacterium]|nr:site-2 protease family protein [Syntrophales bacterium]
MNRHTIPVGRILGIPIGLDYSWFLIFGLITWTMAVGYYPAEFKDWPVAQYWLVGAATAIMLFVSVLLHELGHSVVAMHYKVPVRSITLFIFGGVSQMGAEPPTAVAGFWIAVAGPVVSFALAVLFRLMEPFFAGIAPLLALFKYLVYINVALGLFNLIPGFPLDGGGVFRSIVWGVTHNMRRATLIAANVGRSIAYLFIFFGVWQMFAGNFIDGMWIAFIGWFLENAAKGQVQQLGLHDMLAGHKVSQAMNRQYAAIRSDISLQHLVDDHILASGLRSFVVKRGDAVVGLLTLHHIKEIPRSDWPTMTAAKAMIPVEKMKQVRPDTELWKALEEMDRDGVNQLPVMADGQIRGMLSREDVVGYLRTLRELGA